jgi:hypothetical protein
MFRAAVFFNIIDAIFLGIAIWGIARGRRSDFFTEFFRLAGVLAASVLSLHYYQRIGTFLVDMVPFSWSSIFPNGTFHGFLAFWLISILCILILNLVRDGWVIILGLELPAKIDEIGALLLSIVKVYFLCGLVFIGLSISGDGPLGFAAKNSVSSLVFFKTTPKVYESVEKGVLQKLSTEDLKDEGTLFDKYQKPY